MKFLYELADEGDRRPQDYFHCFYNGNKMFEHVIQNQPIGNHSLTTRLKLANINKIFGHGYVQNGHIYAPGSNVVLFNNNYFVVWRKVTVQCYSAPAIRYV